MTDEEYKKEVNDLSEMLYNLRRIKDKGRTKWLKREIRALLIKILKSN